MHIHLGVLRLTEGANAKHPEEGKGSQMNMYAPIFILLSKVDL